MLHGNDLEGMDTRKQRQDVALESPLQSLHKRHDSVDNLHHFSTTAYQKHGHNRVSPVGTTTGYHPVGTTTGYHHWVPPVGTTTGYHHWVPPVGTTTGDHQWVPPSGYPNWVPPLGTTCRYHCTQHNHSPPQSLHTASWPLSRSDSSMQTCMANFTTHSTTTVSTSDCTSNVQPSSWTWGLWLCQLPWQLVWLVCADWLVPYPMLPYP
jgi:hypothetical protein